MSLIRINTFPFSFTIFNCITTEVSYRYIIINSADSFRIWKEMQMNCLYRTLATLVEVHVSYFDSLWHLDFQAGSRKSGSKQLIL